VTGVYAHPESPLPGAVLCPDVPPQSTQLPLACSVPSPGILLAYQFDYMKSIQIVHDHLFVKQIRPQRE
jgi:hypothetical protein